jgi:signal transduction histidine kinase
MPSRPSAGDEKRKPWPGIQTKALPLFSSFLAIPNRLRIRSYLTALVLSCLVPVCLSSAYLVHYSYQNRIALFEQNLLATAKILSVALDRELAISQSSLEALATSPALASGDMATFHAQARSVLKDFQDSDIILADATGQQIVNSYKPFGSDLPKRSPRKTVLSIFETGRPSISNVFKGAVTGRYLIGVDVPVFQDGKVRYDLAMTRPADHLSTLFSPHELPREWLITILDSDHAIAARSSLPEVYIGRHIESPPLLQLMTAANQGTTEGFNLEGKLSTVSFRRSDTTAWTVLVSVPKAVVAHELGQGLQWVMASLSVFVVFGLVLALIELRRSHSELELRVRERTAELRVSNQALTEHAAKLERLNEELQDFVFVASHDLQEPLRKIQTFCDMAQQRCASALDSAAREYLDRVISSAGRMRQLLHDLLQFSRVAARPERFKEIDLTKVVREAAGLFEEILIKSGALVDIESMPHIEADEAQMSRLFQNLIENGLKYRGDQNLRIKIFAKHDDHGLCEILVQDNGIGFEQQFAERVFKPFQRLHGRKEYQGTGMGLAICRKIVEGHGGSIRAESEPGKGSTFIIRLPVKQDRRESIK